MSKDIEIDHREDQVEEEALVNLGLSLSKALQYAYLHQGLTIKDLLWILHGLIGVVLGWAYNGKKRGMSI